MIPTVIILILIADQILNRVTERTERITGAVFLSEPSVGDISGAWA